VKIHLKTASETVNSETETRHLTEHSLSYLAKMLVIPRIALNVLLFSPLEKNVLAQNEQSNYCRPQPGSPPAPTILTQ